MSSERLTVWNLNAVCNSFSETLALLWGGHLARPNLGGQDAHPTRLSDRIAHRVTLDLALSNHRIKRITAANPQHLQKRGRCTLTRDRFWFAEAWNRRKVAPD